MRKIYLVLISLVMALAMILPVAIPVAAAPDVVGQVTVVSDGFAPGFSGDLQLLSDGSISGQWQWTLFSSNGNEVKFCCEKLSGLSFPKENTAVFSGTFSCRNLPLDYVGHIDTISELSFEVIEVPDAVPANIGTAANPNGLPVALPPGITLPPGYGNSDSSNDMMFAYGTGHILIAMEKGDYQVSVINAK